MRVYNLTKQKHALDNLRRQRIKICLLDELNDPFELMGLALKNREARISFRNFKRQMNEKYGLLCFSKRWHNPVLWAHYGDRHRGICLGFDVPTHLRKIYYSAERLRIVLDTTDSGEELNEASMQKLLFTKYEDWAYEEEYRVYIELEDRDQESKLYFKDFGGDLHLKEVIVGPMCDVSYDEIYDIVAASSDVSIIKARLAFNSYRVVKNRSPGKGWPKIA